MRPGSHWLLIAAAVVAILLVGSVWCVGHRDRAWLPSVRAHKRALRNAVIAAVVLLVLAFVSTHLQRVEGLIERIRSGNPWWLACGAGLEVFSFLGYVALTKDMFSRQAPRLSWPAAVEVTFGGVVATRLLSAGGAGGIAFTTWALHAAGMATRTAAESVAAFLALLYMPYIAALLVGWIGGGVPDAVIYISVAVGAVIAIAVLAMTLIPSDLERRARRVSAGHGRLYRLGAKVAAVPAGAADATRTAFAIARKRPRMLAWAALWWAADVGTLTACFHAFGDVPVIGILITGYFVGHLGNLVPLPGGIGGVEGGMIGVFVACDVPAELAVVATLAYQLISTWLPVVPGVGAYWSLRRRVAGWHDQDKQEPPEAAAPAAVRSPTRTQPRR